MGSLLYQIHGYKNGHQLLFQNVRLSILDQDTVDRLSDISGPIRPGEVFKPYFTCYPLPSKEYFVVARTWQDLTVSRAGCVVTKSIIIPMLDWEALSNPLSIFVILMDSTGEKDHHFVSHEKPTDILPLVNSPVEELIEALFLEIRQQIVVFNCSEPDNITIRLYTVFWVSMKKNFSICTFSLSPRSINGKPFDLQFAPEIVKAKFSDWVGRRIDISIISSRIPRHRWTNYLRTRIFQDITPSLFDENDNNFIPFDENSTEGTLRLRLLLNELLENAERESSPMTILGILDIINSQPVFATELYQKLHPYILNSINNATTKLDTLDAWKFFSALLVKHKRKPMGRQMLNAVREECCILSKNHPEAAIDFLVSNSPLGRSSPSVLLAGLGDGLAGISCNEKGISFIQSISSRHLQMLIATSQKFTKKFIDCLIDRLGDKYSGLLDDLFREMDVNYGVKAKKSLIHFTNSAIHQPLLGVLFFNCKPQFYKYAITILKKNTNFKIKEFNNIILEHTKRLGQYNFLINILLEFNEESNVDSLLISLLISEPSLVSWLCTTDNISLSRKIFILTAIFTNTNNQLENILRSEASLPSTILKVLEVNIDQSYPAYINVVLVSNMPIEMACISINNLPLSIIKLIDKRAITELIIRSFDNISPSINTLLKQILAKQNQIDTKFLIEYVTSSNKSRNYIFNSMKILMTVGQDFLIKISPHSEYISNVFKNYLQDFFDPYFEESWIFLLEASSHSFVIHHRSAEIMLDFAYSCKKYDPTNLVIVSFPIVYKKCLDSNSNRNKSFFKFFSEKDPCKKLNVALVNRYLNSEWSRLGLLKVAIKTNILKNTINILINSKGGEKFINSAIKEAKSTQLPIELSVAKMLRKKT